ncbi:Sucrose synthase 2 isoform D [Glycine soja]|uniref:Sucrose synthase 2 isoform D n=1 Tax=Glycine soja TaxID=3848 RepID=A0A445L156_GLYSO|nr:Sucrose synthase 2 isoform D [Glycine soja]
MTKVYGTGLYDFRRHRVAEYPVAAVSIIIMVNEKFRENVAAWTCFHERKDAFKGFLESVLRLKEGRELSIAEKTNYLVFMINAFQMELCLNPGLIKKWKRMIKKEPVKGDGSHLDPSTTVEVMFVFPLKQLSGEDDELIDATGLGLVNDACVLYCERFMEFLIDLLSQLPTRRYLRPLVADVAVVAKCHLSALYRHEKGKLFAQLVDLLQFYEGFEINDHTGTQLTDHEVLER